MPPDEQRIIFASRQLEEGELLIECGVGHCDLAHLIPRLRGSDARLKARIAPTGRTLCGGALREYTWQWNGAARRHGYACEPARGVLAQEALLVRPGAVARGRGGFLNVDYAQLTMDQ